jgi:hypothetical protein
MSLHHILILVGLTIEIAGAFVLAADAIGLDRLVHWASNLREVRGALTGAKPWARSTFLDPNRFLSALGSAGGVAIGAYWVMPLLMSYPKWLRVPLAAVIGGGGGGLVGLALSISVPIVIQTIASALLRLESRARVHAVGVLGFGLLFLGFSLQFAGTLIDGLRTRVP